MEVVSSLLVNEIWELGLPQTLYFSHSENVEFFWAPQTSVPFAGAFSMIHSVGLPRYLCILPKWFAGVLGDFMDQRNLGLWEEGGWWLLGLKLSAQDLGGRDAPQAVLSPWTLHCYPHSKKKTVEVQQQGIVCNSGTGTRIEQRIAFWKCELWKLSRNI